MKLLQDRKAINGLQELINKSIGNTLDGPRVVRKIGKHKGRTGHEMRLTAQIGEYERDQVILDLKLDVNVLPKQTWERMGRKSAVLSDSVKTRKSAENHPHGKVAGSDS